MSSLFTVTLTKKEDVANGTTAFYFEKPEGYTFFAGQYLHLYLPQMTEPDPEGTRRSFSIAAAPEDPFLRITTRMRDTPFKRTLGEMKIGNTAQIDEASGGLVMPGDPSRPLVFLAGGIGITPFMSMARHAAKAILMHSIILFYSNRTPADAAFLGELNELATQNDRFKVVHTMTDLPESAPWDGERGYINGAMLKRHLDDVFAPIYYIAGPPGMVTALQKMLLEQKVPELQIRTETFDGY